MGKKGENKMWFFKSKKKISKQELTNEDKVIKVLNFVFIN
jgi:hypothetical protein